MAENKSKKLESAEEIITRCCDSRMIATDAYHHDGDDLGRCGKLYDSCAVVRTNIDKVALLGLKWAAIAHGLKKGVNRASLV